MLAVQAAVPCSRVGELLDRLQDYRTTAGYLSKIATLTSPVYMSSQVRDEEKCSTKNGTLKYSQSTPGPGWLSFIYLLQYILCSWGNLKFCCS